MTKRLRSTTPGSSARTNATYLLGNHAHRGSIIHKCKVLVLRPVDCSLLTDGAAQTANETYTPSEPGVQDRLPPQLFGLHVDHSAPTDRCWRGDQEVHRLEHHRHHPRHSDNLAAHEAQLDTFPGSGSSGQEYDVLLLSESKRLKGMTWWRSPPQLTHRLKPDISGLRSTRTRSIPSCCHRARCSCSRSRLRPLGRRTGSTFDPPAGPPVIGKGCVVAAGSLGS